jgi:hypothetical protein
MERSVILKELGRCAINQMCGS